MVRTRSPQVDWPRISLRQAGVELIDCDHRTPAASATGYPYVAIPQVRGGRLRLSEARRIRPEHYAEWTRRAKPKAFDVVLSRRCNPGETAFVEPGVEFALGQNLVILRADGSRVRPSFLRWLVRGPEWWEQINKFINAGAVFESLKCADIPKFELTIPPLEDQCAISQILGDLDEKIELNRQMNETLEAMARAIFKSWFVDFDPVRSKAQGRQPFGVARETAALFPDVFEDSPFGKVPRGFRVSNLGSVVAELETGSRPRGGVGKFEDGIPSIGAESIEGLGKFDFSKTKYVPHAYYFQMSKGRIADRDVLLYKDGGRPGQYEPHVAMFGQGFPFERACINEHVYRLQTRTPLSQAYLYFWLISDLAMDEMRQRGTGVAVPGLNSTAVRSLPILLPSEQILKRYEEITEPIIRLILNNANESRTLAASLDALLPKLISGKLHVSRAEKLIGARM